MRTPRTITALLLAGTLAIAGCGSSEPSSTATAVDDDQTTEPSPASESPPATSASSGSGETLDEIVGSAAGIVRRQIGIGGGGGQGFDADDAAAEQQLVQLEIQRCMIEQGFEYTPEAVGDGLRFLAASENQGLSDAEYAATQGFGISTRFDAVLEGDVDLGDDEPSANETHLETLSEGEADAWQLALRGLPPERNAEGQLINPETGEVLAGGRGQATGGCARDAQVAVRGDFSVLAELEDEFAVLSERIDSDPRIAELRADWASCMRDGGFAYETADEARDDFQEQFRPLIRSFFQGANQDQGGGGGGGGGGQGQALQNLAEQGISAEQEAELRALQDLEIAAAVASLECAGDSTQEIATISARYEADFVEQNRAVLERIAG